MWTNLHGWCPWYTRKNSKSVAFVKKVGPLIIIIIHTILHQGAFVTKNFPRNIEYWFEYCGEYSKFYQRMCSNTFPTPGFKKGIRSKHTIQKLGGFLMTTCYLFFPQSNIFLANYLYIKRWKVVNIKLSNACTNQVAGGEDNY